MEIACEFTCTFIWYRFLGAENKEKIPNNYLPNKYLCILTIYNDNRKNIQRYRDGIPVEIRL